jgi:hypothetical protein
VDLQSPTGTALTSTNAIRQPSLGPYGDEEEVRQSNPFGRLEERRLPRPTHDEPLRVPIGEEGSLPTAYIRWLRAEDLINEFPNFTARIAAWWGAIVSIQAVGGP